MLKAQFSKYSLRFKRPSGTSRGTLTKKDSYFIELRDTDRPDIVGIGECGILRGLSCDPWPEYLAKLTEVCQNINAYSLDNLEDLAAFPSIRFGVEMAIMDLQNGGKKEFFDTSFTHGSDSIPINGLIWMGSEAFMQEQIEEKLEKGFRCIKMKIGAIHFNQEYQILKNLRNRYAPEILEIRVDANGAFSPKEAFIRLDELSKLYLHSIEQPIAPKNWDEMAKLCGVSPLAIALDEELIGVHDKKDRIELLDTIQPQYIILKPSLIGGFQSADEWVSLAEERNIGWWATSALESNIGLNAIAQWTASKKTDMYQGLGTGSLYTNNIPSDLVVEHAALKKTHKP